MTTVLLVEDDMDLRTELGRVLSKKGFGILLASSVAEALALVESQPVDVVISDVRLGRESGVDLCQELVRNQAGPPVVLMTGYGTLDTALAGLRAGASDLLSKPCDALQLELSILRALKTQQVKEEVARLRLRVEVAEGAPSLVGQSESMRQLLVLIDRLSKTDATVLISGESGTGKELVAKELHGRGARKDHPFIAVNCTALPEALLESELFGHVKGAFTDAKQSRRGLFLEADGGTLLLDEVAEMPIGMQAKLLRAIEQRSVRPVGGSAERSFDVRLLAATHRDLPTWVTEGRFREDLYYRLNVVEIEVPPLRARGTDVLTLAEFFLERFARRKGGGTPKLLPEARERLLAYSWPGNVRELRNCMERLDVLGDGPFSIADLPAKLRSVASPNPAQREVALITLEEVERRHLQDVLTKLSGNRTAATKVLGIDRSTLYRKLERYKLVESAIGEEDGLRLKTSI